jgi:hypothetical protein
MSIIISIDNDSATSGIQPLIEDESPGVQTPLTADTGNDIAVTLTNPVGGALGGFVTAFNTALDGTLLDGFVLTDAQKVFAATNDGASSSTSFITVTTTAGETVSDLFFSDSSGNPLSGAQVAGMQTLDGSNVYLWSSGNFAIATTSATLGQGQIVAAFYLNEAANHLSAQVQMVTFTALKHPVTTNPDDALNFTDVLQVSAAGSTSFDFNTLQSGDFLWVAVDGATGGSAGGAVLVTGGNPQVDSSTNKITNTSDDIHVSQGGDGTTIGVNNQLFDNAGETAVFTLVKNLATLPSGVTGAGGSYTVDPNTHDAKLEGISYQDYLNVVGSGVYISQSQGTPTLPKSLEVKLLNAGPGPEAGTNYIPGLASDASVNVGTVTIKDDAGHVVGTWGAGGLASGTGVANTSPNGSTTVTVTINGNTLDVSGVLGQYTVDWTAASGTFNRFDVTWEAGKFDLGRVDIIQGAAAHVGVGSDLVVQDSGPSVAPTLVTNATVSVDESAPSTVPTLNTGAIVKGVDPDNPDPVGGAALGYATSGVAVVDPHAVFNTDGPATGGGIGYALSIINATSGLTTTEGNAINLQLVGGVIVGVVSGGAFNGQAAFAIAIDSTTGVVTVEQYLSLHHNSADTNGDTDEAVQATLNTIGVTVTATDGDGDHVTSSAVDISHQISFHDDGPTASPALNANATVSLDESGPAAASTISTGAIVHGDDPDVTGSGAIAVAVSGSAIITPHAAFGADGPAASGSLTYALSLSAQSVASGLTTTEGNAINLQLAGGVVVGVVSGGAFDGQAAFAIAISASTGVVTVEQYLSLHHNSADTNGDSNEFVQIALGSVGVTVTATDGDGDSFTSSAVDISHQISFHDDGPTASPTLNANATVSLDESGPAAASTISTGAIVHGDDPDVTGSGAIAVGVSGGAVVTPHAAFGADGPAASGSLTYALSLSASSVPSGLTTTEGNAINLQLAGGVVVGVVSGGAFDGQAAFAIAISASTGVVTVEQYLSLHHNSADVGVDSNEFVQMALGSVGVTVTATDGDSDSFTSGAVDISHQISFHDDGPTITASSVNAASITDDESNFAVNNTASYAAQFTPSYGADGPAGTPVTYAIAGTSGADSGLIESGTGNHVFLFNESGVVVGRAGATAAAAATGDIVFTVGVDGTGTVTLDQRIAVVHNPNTGPDQSTTLASAGLVAVSATAHDGDGDTASASLNIGTLLNFKDDAPTITSQIQSGTVAFAIDATGTVTNSLNGSVGADIDNATQQSLSGVKEYTITSWTTPTNVFAGLNAVLSTDGTTLTYYSDAADTNAVYRLGLNQTANSGAGSYTFTVLQPPPITETHFGFADLHSGQNLFGIIAVNKADIVNGVLPDGGLLVMPNNPVLAADGTPTNTSGTICTSQGGGGVTIGNTNQAFDRVGEGAYFLYVDNPVTTAVSGVGLTPTGANDADTIGFNGVNQATDARVEIVQASGDGSLKKPGPGIHIAAWEVNPGNVNSNAAAENLVKSPTAGGTQVDIIGVKIHDATGAVVEYDKMDQAAGHSQAGIVQDLNGDGIADNTLVGVQFILEKPNGAGTADDVYGVQVTNLKQNYSVEFITASNHDLALVENLSGSYDLGGFNVSNRVNVPAQHFDFSAQISDYDNDVFGGSLQPFAKFSVDLSGLVF